MKGMFEKTAIGNMIFLFGPFVFMLLFVFFLTAAQKNYLGFIIFTSGLFIVGFGMFMYSKIINLKKGKFVSFGVKDMHKNQKALYFIGYVFMFVGVLCAAILAIMSSS